MGELGFGSGLNFLQTLELWQQCDERPRQLHYIAFEKYPLTLQQLSRIHQRWPKLSQQSSAFIAQYTDHSEGCHRLLLAVDVVLDLYFGDALAALNARMSESCPAIQCWFLDGFSPAKNSELWQQELMQALAASSDNSTTLSSYSVAGKVRSALKNSGFEVFKVAGFGRKRHSLFAQKSDQPAAASKENISATPWFDLAEVSFQDKTVVVIGAGLAGCSTAHSLAQRGWRVILTEAGSDLASGASGNSHLALRCRLLNADSSEARFFLHAYLFACRQFQQLQSQHDIGWNPCAVVQLANAMNKRRPLLQENLQQLYSEQIVRRLSKQEASKQAAVLLDEEALFFPQGGAMQAAALCRSYIDHPNIELKLNTRISALSRNKQSWSVAAGSEQFIDADAVVIANSYGAAQLTQCQDLALQLVRGQTTEIPANANSEKLASVVCGARTVFPAAHNRHLISASYHLSDSESPDLEPHSEDSTENIRLAQSNFPAAELLSSNAGADRVSLRCNSADRFPIVGLLPDTEKMKTTYAALSKNASAKFTTRGHYLPGLYVNIAHGSNGLASCPISAELLASMINRENLPLSRNIIHSLNPSRFLIRDLQKQKEN